MKALIMAGGMGTRLRPVTGDRPKPMAELLGRPIMEHLILRLRRCGFEDICAALRYRAEDIMDYFGDGSGFGVRMQYRIEDEPLGTAGAVKNCSDFYGDEDFLVISADAACDFCFEELMAAHKKSGACASIALYRDKSPLRYGLAVTNAQGFIRAFIEKPDWPGVVTDLINTGIYVLSPRALEPVPPGRQFDFGRELFPLLLSRGERLLGLEMQGYWQDIGTPASFFRCCADAVEGKWKTLLPEGYGDSSRPSSGPDAPGRRLSEAKSAEDGLSALCPCRDRAGLMGQLSRELMELGADYSRGIRLNMPRFEMSIRPEEELSALRIAVKSADRELARDMLALAKDAVEKLGM